MSKIAYFTRFMPSLERGGGSRRTMQIIDMLRESGVHVVSAPRGDAINAERSAQIEKAAGALDIADNNPGPALAAWSPQRRRGVFRLGEIAREWSGNNTLFEDIALALVDDPIYFPPLIEALTQRNIPVIAVCHNIESLSRGQVAVEASLPLLKQEIEILKTACLVVTISKEEDWLLNNLGLPSYFFPYFPVEEIRKRMAIIRDRRIHSDKSGYLVVGTAHNVQTRRGMRQLIRFWGENNLSNEFGTLRIAGFATESFIQTPDQECGIELLGSLDDQALDNALAQTRACICYQESGAGALTRIPELLIAHVPVVANTYAARSYSGTSGIIEFECLEALPIALRSIDKKGYDFLNPTPPANHLLTERIMDFRQSG